MSTPEDKAPWSEWCASPAWYWDLSECGKGIEKARKELLNNEPVRAYATLATALERFSKSFSLVTNQCEECQVRFGNHAAAVGDIFPACSKYKEVSHESLT